jgi:hypothetical protein
MVQAQYRMRNKEPDGEVNSVVLDLGRKGRWVLVKDALDLIELIQSYRLIGRFFKKSYIKCII